LISAAPYRDRVVHHALCNIIEPVFERRFIFDSYANRLGKGTHRALDRCTQFVRSHRYVLKADIQKYFHSIDHEILLSLLAKTLKDKAVLLLLEKVIVSSQYQQGVVHYFPGDDLLTPFQRSKGIPIGNLTSQFFANVYLNGLDHFIKRTLKGGAYIRFCDDFVLFHDDKSALQDIKRRIQEYLLGLRLVLHPRKTQVFPVTQGVPFLGFKVFPQYRILNQQAVQRFRQRLRRLQYAYQQGEIPLAQVSASVRSWVNHAAYGDTFYLRQSLLDGRVFRRS
jgi:retron-type reverse transcriptase